MAATDRTAGETDDGHGLLTAALLKALGTRGGQALGLHACLQRLRRDQALAGQGFRTVGEFAPGLSLWPNNVRLTPPKVDPLLQRGHADRVTGIAFRSDGGRMITASMDSTIRVCARPTRSCCKPSPGRATDTTAWISAATAACWSLAGARATCSSSTRRPRRG